MWQVLPSVGDKKTSPPLWWQSAIAFAGSCTLSEYFPSINKYIGPPYCLAECTLTASHAALVSHGEYADGTDRQTDGRQTVTLRFPLEAATVTNYVYNN